MAGMWSAVFGSLAAVGFGTHLLSKFIKARRAHQEAPERLFGAASAIFDESYFEATGSVGYPQLVGNYRGHFVQVRPVIDTLAVRKLPSLWLLVTIPTPLPLTATFDLMMRPAGPMTFSNFERLPVTLAHLPDFPELCVVRTDDPAQLPPFCLIAPHLGIFADPHGKELLITPKGLRMVWQLGEAERGRYGVFRQVEFGEVRLAPGLLQTILDRLIAIQQAIIQWKEASFHE
jgi:hypothetical protein